MDDLSRLRTLLGHWREHNDEHAETYLAWSERIAPGDQALSQTLRRLSEETKKLSLLFDEALGQIR